MTFEELGLAEGLLKSIAREGYTTPTPIQARGIPVVLSGRDLLAAAQTGTGKTAAFTLPILQMLTTRERPANAPRIPRALVLVPTRELAAQVEQSVRTYGRDVPAVKSAVIFGGVGINPQIDLLRRGVDIVVATPGRLLDHVGQRTVNLSGVEMLVLDEADRMLDMGFIHDIKRVLATLPKQRQNLMFSATFSDDIRRLATGLLKDPETIDIAPRNTTVELINQRVVQVDQSRKTELLAYLISSGNWRQTLVFTRTKHGANRVCEKLSKWGITTAALHGNKSQNARTKALADFKSGAVRVLVATDIAARGLDIEDLPHVVNFELPNVPEDYVHRIGRTGRAGASGEALALVCREEREYLRDIQKLIKRELPAFVVEGFEIGSKSTLPQEPEEARPPKPPQRHGHRQGQKPRQGGQPQRPNGGRGGQPGKPNHHSRPQRDSGRNAGKSS